MNCNGKYNACHATLSETEKTPMTTSRIRVSAALMTTAMGIAVGVITVLSLLALFNTGYFLPPRPYETTITSERMQLNHGMPTPLFFAGCLLLIFFLLIFATIWLKTIPRKNIGLLLFIYSIVVCVTWVLTLNITGSHFAYPDSTSLVESANALTLERSSDFNPHGAGHPSFYAYYSWYPFQTGALLWFTFIFLLFGSENLVAFLIINAILVSASIWAMWKICVYMRLNEIGLRIAALILMMDIPLITSSGFIYTNAAGFCFILFAVLSSLKAIHENSELRISIWICISFFVAAIAMAIKGTVILFTLAMVIILIIFAFRKRMYWIIPLDIVLFLLAHWSTTFPLRIVESLTSQHFGTGLPQLSWIAIGLTHDSSQTSMPGWWNIKPIHIYGLTHGNSVMQKNYALTTISNALKGFISDPQMAITFFTHKLASEWAEPTYQGFYYSSSPERKNNSLLFTMTMLGDSNRRIIAFENVYQFILYAMSAIGFVIGIANRKHDLNRYSVQCYTGIIIIIGFSCFFIWEAKSVYVLPFTTMMIPSASYGLQNLYTLLNNQMSHQYSNLISRFSLRCQ